MPTPFRSRAPNLVIANDDDPSIGLSGFATTLTAGLTYTFVTTSFSNGDAFRYADAITQTSTTAVPEAGTLALMSSGLGVVGLLARRRSA